MTNTPTIPPSHNPQRNEKKTDIRIPPRKNLYVKG